MPKNKAKAAAGDRKRKRTDASKATRAADAVDEAAVDAELAELEAEEARLLKQVEEMEALAAAAAAAGADDDDDEDDDDDDDDDDDEEEEDDESSGSEDEFAAADANNSDNDSEVDIDTIPITFDAVEPKELHFQGIRSLLKMLCQHAEVDISGIADLLLKQKETTSIVEVVQEDEGEDDSQAAASAAAAAAAAAPAADDEDAHAVFGMTSLIDLRQHRKAHAGVKSAIDWLLQACPDKATKAKLEKTLEKKRVGWILSERFVNIPPSLAVALYSTLFDDLEATNAGKFDAYLFVCKQYELHLPAGMGGGASSSGSKKKGAKKARTEVQRVYVNAEEEYLADGADTAFSFALQSSGGDAGDATTKLFRQVLLLTPAQVAAAQAKMEADFGGDGV